MSLATLARTGPRGFVPPDGAAAETRPRLSHLDPRPLWLEEAVVASPWKSPTFWLACAVVLPGAALVKAFRLVIQA
jgi:hypothetical protein